MIKPLNAITLWFEDRTIYLDCPSPDGKCSHTLTFPDTVEGMVKVLSVIRQRRPTSRLGEPGDPTQHHVDLTFDEAKVKRPKPKYAQPVIDAANAVLQKLGML